MMKFKYKGKEYEVDEPNGDGGTMSLRSEDTDVG